MAAHCRGKPSDQDPAKDGDGVQAIGGPDRGADHKRRRRRFDPPAKNQVPETAP